MKSLRNLIQKTLHENWQTNNKTENYDVGFEMPLISEDIDPGTEQEESETNSVQFKSGKTQKSAKETQKKKDEPKKDSELNTSKPTKFQTQSPKSPKISNKQVAAGSGDNITVVGEPLELDLNVLVDNPPMNDSETKLHVAHGTEKSDSETSNAEEPTAKNDLWEAERKRMTLLAGLK